MSKVLRCKCGKYFFRAIFDYWVRMSNNMKMPRTLKNLDFKPLAEASLVTKWFFQWLRAHLSMQWTQVWSLVQEDPTWHGATKPLCCNYWSLHTLEAELCNRRSHHNKSAHHNEDNWRLLQLEKACVQQWRSRSAKNK